MINLVGNNKNQISQWTKYSPRLKIYNVWILIFKEKLTKILVYLIKIRKIKTFEIGILRKFEVNNL